MKDMNYEGEKLITAVIMQAVEDAGYDGINKKFLKVKSYIRQKRRRIISGC